MLTVMTTNGKLWPHPSGTHTPLLHPLHPCYSHVTALFKPGARQTAHTALQTSQSTHAHTTAINVYIKLDLHQM